MFPQPMPRSDYPPEGSHPDLTSTLEQHIHAGFQPDLALDLVLNELVVRAAEATNATSAALALSRGEELVCRAATGNFAPDLGVPLNPREGLSGVCLRTRQPQLSVDAEVDPRVAAAFSRRFGIRSVLVVPVFDVDKVHFMGVLEVFSPAPAAFSSADQYLLEAYADECARVRQAAFEFSQPKSVLEMPPPEMPEPPEPPESMIQAYAKAAAAPAEIAMPIPIPRILPAPEIAEPDIPWREVSKNKRQASQLPASEVEVGAPEILKADVLPTDFALLGGPPEGGSTYEGWTLFLGALAILAIIGVSFVIGSRIGWFRAAAVAPATVSPPSAANIPQAPPATSSGSNEGTQPEAPRRTKAAAPPKSTRSESRAVTEKSANSAAEGNDLVVYEKGKVVFRMKNGPGEPYPADQPNNSNSVNPAAEPAAVVPSAPAIPPKSAPAQSVWLNPGDAQNRLVNRTEPQYPAAARASRRSGDVVLEIDVAKDGSVDVIHTVKGDPLLTAAAIAAVRNWRYQPYLVHGRPSPFHTDVTLSFTYSN